MLNQWCSISAWSLTHRFSLGAIQSVPFGLSAGMSEGHPCLDQRWALTMQVELTHLQIDRHLQKILTWRRLGVSVHRLEDYLPINHQWIPPGYSLSSRSPATSMNWVAAPINNTKCPRHFQIRRTAPCFLQTFKLSSAILSRPLHKRP